MKPTAVAIMGIAALALAGCSSPGGAAKTNDGEKQLRLRGALSVASSYGPYSQADCVPYFGYQVAIKDGAGKILTVTKVSQATVNGTGACMMPYSVTVPRVDVYQVSVPDNSLWPDPLLVNASAIRGGVLPVLAATRL